MTLIQKLNPVNKVSEKKKFFFDPSYNPQFVYAEHITPEEFSHYGQVEDEHLPVAMKILDTVAKMYGSHDEYVEKKQRAYLSRDEVEKSVKEYLEKEKLDKLVKMKFSMQAVTRTSMYADTIMMRLPVEYTKQGLLGMLYHEIGTHYFRTMNDRKQVWHGNATKFHLHPYAITEEGLAVLHGSLPKADKILRNPALRYYSVQYAASHSFSQLFEELRRFEPRKERRWDLCLRVKRGMTDTSQPGAFAKDQIYLVGALTVWKWLKVNNFDASRLYIGKISLEDETTLAPIASSTLSIPVFISEDTEHYKRELLELGKINSFK